MNTPSDPSQGLKELLSSLRSDPAAPPPSPVPPSAPPAAPTPPPDPAPALQLTEFLMRRVAELEKGLVDERERARASEARAARQEANRGEVEEQLRSISELVRRERDDSHARGRIEALEARLDKQAQAWGATLERLAAREDDGEKGRLDELSARVSELAAAAEDSRAREELKALTGRIDALGAGVDGLTASLARALEAMSAREAEARRERESLSERLDALCRQFAEVGGGLRRAFEEMAVGNEAAWKTAVGESAQAKAWVRSLTDAVTEALGRSRESEAARARASEALMGRLAAMEETVKREFERESLESEARGKVLARRVFELGKLCQGGAVERDRRMIAALEAVLNSWRRGL